MKNSHSYSLGLYHRPPVRQAESLCSCVHVPDGKLLPQRAAVVQNQPQSSYSKAALAARATCSSDAPIVLKGLTSEETEFPTDGP